MGVQGIYALNPHFFGVSRKKVIRTPILSRNFGAEDAERLAPFKDDKPEYAEIMPFQASSDYFSIGWRICYFEI